jgi:AraC-like DNA-binding protein
MDALSEALGSVCMTGAIFYHAECTSPWAFAVPPLRQYAHVLAPGTERLVSYHLMTEGSAIVRFGDAQEVPVTAGDVLIFPHGDPHVVSNGPSPRIVNAGGLLDQYLAGDLSTLRIGGGGAVSRFVCGFFGCDRHADRLFLSGLPIFIKVSLRDDQAGQWLEHSIRHLVAEAGGTRPGRSVLLSKMAEALFIETLRRYMEHLPAEQTGWLAAARDGIVGAAIAAMHRTPDRQWTLDDLAVEAATSRSILTKRFECFLGEPPLSYLAMWRMQLAARRLQRTRESVLAVALEVGYESEAGFIRAFKRAFGLPPARYRKAHLATGGLAAVSAEHASSGARRRSAGSSPPASGCGSLRGS